MTFYLYVAGGLPSLGILAILFAGMVTQSQQNLALLAVSVVGAAGYAFTLWIYRRLQADIEALIESTEDE